MLRTNGLRAVFMAAVMSTCVARASAEEPLRQWLWGGESLEARLINYYSNITLLRKDDGEDYPVGIGDLSRTDQQYVAQWRLAKFGGPPTEEVKLKAKPVWKKIGVVGGEKPVPRICVAISMHGLQAARASKYGDLQIDAFETDGGKTLEPSPSNLDLQGKMKSLKRYGFIDQPPAGLEFDIDTKSADLDVRAIRRLSGSFKIVTGEPHVIEIKNVRPGRKQKLNQPVLADLGLKGAINHAEPSFGFVLEPGQAKPESIVVEIDGSQDRVLSIEIIATDGLPFYGFASSGAVSSNDHTNYSFTFPDKAPAGLRLRLTVLKHAIETRVPFDFQALPVPVLDVEKKKK